MVTNENIPEIFLWLKRTSAVVGLFGAIFGCILGGWSIISQLQENRQIRTKVQFHLSTGDDLATNQRYNQAIKEYEKAIEIDEKNIEVHRRIIRATRRQLTLKAFPAGDPAIDFALRKDYGMFAYVSNSEIDAVLARIYQVQAFNPTMKDDIELLLEEALILKTNGGRTKEAINVLKKAYKLAPENPKIISELGLLLAVLSHDSSQRAEGITLIQHAIQYRPNEASYHFYLARSLAEAFRCPYAGLEYHGADDAQACAEAIRAYQRARNLSKGDDILSRQIRSRALVKSIDIFHRYARKEKDILTSKLSMPLDERIKELEYLISEGVPRYQTGLTDNPEFWLATLYHKAGRPEKAYPIIRNLLERDHDSWFGKDKHYWEDEYYAGKRLPYFELLVKILESSGDDPKTLDRVKSLMKSTQPKNKVTIK